MLPAILFALLVVLLFHLFKVYSKPKPPALPQPMPKIELREVGFSSRSTRFWHPKSPYERIPLTAKQRYEILKRDNFTCRYCGRKPPEVVLNVDHIISVYDGGTNEPSNLTASCEPCNKGKGSDSLSIEVARAG